MGVPPHARAEIFIISHPGTFCQVFFAGKLHKFDPEILYTLSIEILVRWLYNVFVR